MWNFGIWNPLAHFPQKAHFLYCLINNPLKWAFWRRKIKIGWKVSKLKFWNFAILANSAWKFISEIVRGSGNLKTYYYKSQHSQFRENTTSKWVQNYGYLSNMWNFSILTPFISFPQYNRYFCLLQKTALTSNYLTITTKTPPPKEKRKGFL